MKDKAQTKERVTQLAAIYRKQGYDFPANMSGTFIAIDSTGAHQVLMGGCDPKSCCFSGLSIPFNSFTVVTDVQTKMA